jgi:hypothetical protein
MLFFLLASTCLSCSKDDDEQPDDPKTTAELIKGTWTLNSVHYDYFDSSNNLLYRDPEEDAKGTWTFDGQVVNLTFQGEEGSGTSNYIITEEGDEQYLNINSSEIQRLRIYSIDENSMILGDDFGPDTYFQDGVEKQAANSSVRANFTR